LQSVPLTSLVLTFRKPQTVPQTSLVLTSQKLHADVPEATVCATSDGITAAFFSATSNCSDDATAGFFSAISSPGSSKLYSLCCPRLYCLRPPSADVPQAPVCQTEDTVSSLLSDLEDDETLII
ncbi:hypothetical protein M9458_007056, partial [Cirrhinus mrigala]